VTCIAVDGELATLCRRIAVGEIWKKEDRTMSKAERFSFGKNWQNFRSGLSGDNIDAAAACLNDKLGDLTGKTFLDVGCGSGIHSLAALRLGASRVHSFDYDRDSVECSRRLKLEYAADSSWTIEVGSALDEGYLRSLGTFDVVYSWGVLHHTGEMWKALDLISIPLQTDGQLFIALYNDQGSKSKVWKRIKKTYNLLPGVVRPIYVCGVTALPELVAAIRQGPTRYIKSWRGYRSLRGMSRWHDLVDWVGGYPFEVASPGAVFDFFKGRGFSLEKLRTTTSLGCNEYVFQRRGYEPFTYDEIQEKAAAIFL
jgi:2-polyprenyl-3-methyl-5-hydroxy-6-metoxy-1,4-benzoquinol methylase